jgi:hypothetical protein
MSPYAKAVVSVLRLASCGLIILSFGLCSSDFYLFLSHRPYSKPVVLALKIAPALGGLALAWKAKPIAIHLTKDLD